jgi:GAF domain-containing protein
VTDAATEVAGAQFGAFFYNQNTAVFAPTFAGEAIVRSADITRDPRYGRSAPHHGMPAGHLPVRSYLAVPVVSRSGEVLGGLFFGHADPGVFTDRAERLVAGIASQAATAIDNARLYRSLQESEQRFGTVLESQAEMVCRFRLDGTILFVNAAYVRAASATPEAMVGRDFWTFIPDDERTRVRELLAQLTPKAGLASASRLRGASSGCTAAV